MRDDCIHGISDAWCDLCHPKLTHGKALWAEKVFQLIPAYTADEWITMGDLADGAGLTGDQAAQGVAFLREHHPEFPLISSVRGYRFSIDGADIAQFRRWRARSARTTVGRLWRGAIKPYIEQTAEPLEARQTTKQFERLLEDLDELTA